MNFIFQAIKSIPGCTHPLVSRILPYIGPILNKVWFSEIAAIQWLMVFNNTLCYLCTPLLVLIAPRAGWWLGSWVIRSRDNVTEGKYICIGSFKLEFIYKLWPLNTVFILQFLISVCHSFVQNSPGDVVKAIYDVCFNAVLRIILQSDEHSEIQVIFFFFARYMSISHFISWFCNDFRLQHRLKCFFCLDVSRMLQNVYLLLYLVEDKKFLFGDLILDQPWEIYWI